MNELITSLKKTISKHIGRQIISLTIINAINYTYKSTNAAKQLIHSKQYNKLKDLSTEDTDADSLIICDVELIDGTRSIALVVEPLELYANGYVESVIQY